MSQTMPPPGSHAPGSPAPAPKAGMPSPAPPAPSPYQAQPAVSAKNTLHKVVPVEISTGEMLGADGIVVYGPEGIGKSTLAACLPSPFFFDLEKSTSHLNVNRDRALYENPTTQLLRGKLAAFAASPPKGVRSLVIDTSTKMQSILCDYVVGTKTATNDRGSNARHVASIEDFGWGRGWKYVFEEFDAILADIDRVREKGINVCLISHAVPSPFVNPLGEDFTRYEPHLYPGDKARNASIRDRVKQWADHIIFIGYDLFVKEGKGIGSGSRTAHTMELPSHAAKSRTIQTSQPFEPNDPGAIWRTLGIK